MDSTAEWIERVYGRHPARALPFDELCAGLDRAAAEGRVYVNRDGPLELFSYSRLCLYEGGWDLFALMARGLVIDRAARRVLATPFPKFFNYGEQVRELPAMGFEVTEKVDGSLGIIFHHEGAWRVTTRGCLTSDQGAWATRWLSANIDASALVPGTTYLAEVVYRANRVVIPYDFEGMVLLAAYDEQGRELSRGELEAAAGRAGMRTARRHAYDSLDALLDVSRKLAGDEEGFVVRFTNGLRVKLKGDEYCRRHRLMCQCTPLGIWEAMREADDLSSMRQDLPEEMRGDFDRMRELIEARFETMLEDVRRALAATAHLSDKEVAAIVYGPAGGGLTLSDDVRKFLFMARKRDFLGAVRGPGELRRKAFLRFRPDGNSLEGYEPSNAMTRFAAEDDG